MKIDRLNWNDLRYFLEVERKGRLLGAAKCLGVNRTTVARRIAALEDSLEARLFERTERGFHLTPAGEALLPLAEGVEYAADFAKERVQSSDQAVSGTLRIGVPDGFGNAFLASYIVPFMHDNPGLTLELAPLPLPHNLLIRGIDLAVSLEPTKQPKVSNTKITEYKLFLYTSRAYLARKKLDVTRLESLLQEAFSRYISDNLYTEQLNFSHHINTAVDGQFRSSTVVGQYEFLANGGGLGVLPHFMAWNDDRLVPILTREYCFVRGYWLLVPDELRRFASVRRLQRFILSIAAEHRKIFMPNRVKAFR